MNLLDAVILGLVQGLTEFLPISSSGHLVIGEALLGFHVPGVTLEVWLHLGTLLAVLVYFRRAIYKMGRSLLISSGIENQDYRRLLLAIAVGTLPAVAVGFGAKSFVETAFSKSVLVSAMLILTGIILLVSQWAINRDRPINALRGFVIGIAQAFAILPGISRSGSTITIALFLGVSPSRAAEFSFLLAIPAIGGAFLLDLLSSGGAVVASGQLPIYLAGTAISFVVGYFSIYYLMRIIKRGRFYLFGLYCLVVGTVSVIYLV